MNESLLGDHNIIVLAANFGRLQISAKYILTYISVWNSIIDCLYNSCHVEFRCAQKQSNFYPNYNTITRGEI